MGEERIDLPKIRGIVEVELLLFKLTLGNIMIDYLS
jgi:hypothetical protein